MDGEAAYSDVAYDLMELQFRSVCAVRGSGRRIRAAEAAGKHTVAAYFRAVRAEDAERAEYCQELLGALDRPYGPWEAHADDSEPSGRAEEGELR
ncbi:hypothetical protein ACGFX4_09605 [Kitasatospora sp. NPDC048365]|uniref:hypothetical protein n=1 Tax=Kitasatospora sp. NPDC048365 TaxID=3364050 RepID=UPI003717CB97